MKINLDKELPMGKSHNYKKDSMEGAPEIVQKVLEIEGVKGVYHVADFLAIERNAKYDWREILPFVRKHLDRTRVWIVVEVGRKSMNILVK